MRQATPRQNARTVVVTGATRGIGAEISRAFARQGDCVLMGGRHDTGVARSIGACARFVKMDVRWERDHVRLARLALKWTGRLDVYINNAGISAWRHVEKVDDRFFQTLIDTNLKGVFWGCKTAARFMSGGGCIINISSLAGRRGSANNSVYCASKFGVTGLTQALAKELGPRRIRVNAVCPVYVLTDSLAKALGEPGSPAGGKSLKKYLAGFALDQAALRRLPSAAEIAQACLFLSSAGASAITGQSLNVDCGVLPQ